MLEVPSLEHFLNRAREHERQYRWSEVAESYLQAVKCLSAQDLSAAGKFHEKIGCCLYRAAMQADSPSVFQDRMHQSIAAYEDASGSAEPMTDLATRARRLRCDAMIRYLRSWLTLESNEKKLLLDESYRLARESLKAFEESGESLEFAKTFDVFSLSVRSKVGLEWNVAARRDATREGLLFGEKALVSLSPSRDRDMLAGTYVRLAAFLEELGASYDIDKRYRYHQRAHRYWTNAKKLSKDGALRQLAFEGAVELCGGTGTEEALTTFSQALESARVTGDKFLIGRALDGMAYHTSWRALSVEDREEKLKHYKSSLALAVEADEEFSKVCYTSLKGGVLWAHAPHAEHYWQLGVRYETDPRRKQLHLEKALQAIPVYMEKAQRSGSPDIITTAHHVASKILVSLAKLELDLDRKESLLREAESHRYKAIELAPTHRLLNYWESAVDEYGLSQVQFSLAQIASDHETRKRRLEEAATNMKAALDHAIRHMRAGEGKHSPSDYAHLAIWYERYGELLSNLYSSTKEEKLLRDAAESLTQASENFDRSDQSTRVAESFWKRAQCYEALDEHLNSADDFFRAARSYGNASNTNRSLKSLFERYASYMHACGQIELATHYHREQKFRLASQHYEKAVTFLRSSSKWNYMATNYSAWAELERGQELSMRQQSRGSI